MLSCPLDEPVESLGHYVQLFLREAPWVRRRVETVRFIDVGTVGRRVTLDIGIGEVRDASATAPLIKSRPLVPLTLLRKELLMDFDLRGASNNALPVIPREIDSFLAWSSLGLMANGVLGIDVHAERPAVSEHLRSIAWSFPIADDAPELRAEDMHSWREPDWDPADHDTWQALLRDAEFQRHLRDFTFGFLLVTQLAVTSHLEIVKFSYRQNIGSSIHPMEAVGLDAIELNVDMPVLALKRGYHLRVEAPKGLTLTDVGMFRLVDDPERFAPADDPERYQKRVGADWAQVYTSPPAGRDRPHALAVHLRMPLSGFLRSAWLATLFTVALLAASRLRLNDVEASIDSRAGAAVAIGLIGPSLLSTYLVRPDEHALTGRLVRPLRYAVAVCAVVGYLGAGIVAMAEPTSELETQFNWLVSVAAAVATYVSVVLWRSDRDIARSQERTGTMTDDIVDVWIEP